MNPNGEDAPQVEIEGALEFDLSSRRVIGQSYKETSEAITYQLYDFFVDQRSKISAQLDLELSNGNHLESFLLLEKAYDEGEFYFNQDETLLKKINVIERSSLSDQQLFKLLQIKFHIASRQGAYGFVEEDAKLFLGRYREQIDKHFYDGIVLLRANGAAQNNKKELAHELYRRLLDCENNTFVSTYAWAARGIANLLNSSDPEFYKYHEIAADAFLQSGQRIEAVISIHAMADFKEKSNLKVAFDLMEKADSLLNSSDFNNLLIRGASHYRKARILSKLKSYEDASHEVEQAISLCNRLIGCEDELFSYLSLAVEIYQNLNDLSHVERLNARKKELKPLLRDKSYQFQVEFADSIRSSSSGFLAKLPEELKISENKDLEIAFHILNAVNNPELEFEDRLEEIECTISMMESDKFSNEICSMVCMSAASIYMQKNLDSKAIEWYRKVLKYDSLNFVAIQNLATLFEKNQMWKESACFFEKQRQQFGNNAASLFYHGKALLKLGDANKAAPILTRSLKLAEECGIDSLEYIEEVRDEALDSADELENVPAVPIIRSEKKINRRDFENCLNKFKQFLQAEKRMTFWTFDKERKKHKWINSPEKHAQNLLHTYIKASFEEQVDIFEEIDAGAGRMDILIRFSSNFSIIAELKMCGNHYPLNYAKGGLDQLSHYLSNKSTSLGYLIIFDARTRDFGKGLSKVLIIERHTIFTYFIDVRPSI